MLDTAIELDDFKLLITLALLELTTFELTTLELATLELIRLALDLLVAADEVVVLHKLPLTFGALAVPFA